MNRFFLASWLTFGITLGLVQLPVLVAQEPPEPEDSPAVVSEPEATVPASVIPESAVKEANPNEGLPPEPEEEPTLAPLPSFPNLGENEGAPPEPEEEAAPGGKTPAVKSAESEEPETDEPSSAVDSLPPAATNAEQYLNPKKLDPAVLAEIRRTGPRKVLELSDISESQLRPIQDGWPLSDDELEITLKLLYRVRRFNLMDLNLWTSPDPPLEEMAQSPDKYRLQMFSLRGRVEQVTIERPIAEVVDRYEMPEYYSCLVILEGSNYPVLIVTPTIPSHWNLDGPLNEPVSAQGLFLKVGENRGDFAQLDFLAPRLAWHPDKVQEHQGEQSVSFGMTELGQLKMDVGLLEDVENRERITDRDREAFYQMLAAMDRAPQNQLARIARGQLPEMVKIWQADLERTQARLAEQKEKLKTKQGSATEYEELNKEIKETTSRVGVLKHALKEAEEGRYSVYPLFNLADEQRGRLVLLEGIARRAVKVEVANPRKPDSNRDILERFEIDHYYELAIFTKDSSDNPIIICVRELPPGFPEGEHINQAVQVAGFFFKTWAFYTNEGARSRDQLPPVPRRKLAPLLIAKTPIWIQSDPAVADSNVPAIIAIVFLTLMAVATFSVWRFNKRDEEFRKEVLVRKYDLDTGLSLNDAGLVTVDGPDFSHLKDENIEPPAGESAEKSSEPGSEESVSPRPEGES